MPVHREGYAVLSSGVVATTGIIMTALATTVITAGPKLLPVSAVACAGRHIGICGIAAQSECAVKTRCYAAAVSPCGGAGRRPGSARGNCRT